jgi:hypothetical protein
MRVASPANLDFGDHRDVDVSLRGLLALGWNDAVNVTAWRNALLTFPYTLTRRCLQALAT